MRAAPTQLYIQLNKKYTTTKKTVLVTKKYTYNNKLKTFDIINFRPVIHQS